jgi:serine/threonine-protein kinase RsbW
MTRHDMNESALPGLARLGYADPSRIAWAGIPANPSGATLARMELARWLETHFGLDGTRTGDVVLAVYEALANAVDAAPTTDSTMDLHATHDQEHRTLVVTVSDRGEWGSAPLVTNRAASVHRGRGMPLMRALSDHTRIDTDDDGTAVSLTWKDVTAARTPPGR